MLIGNNVNKSFDGRPVLRDVNISIHPGQITAIIGPSGSGKTTLLRALSLLEEPDSGVVAVDDLRYTFPRHDETNGIVRPWPRVTLVFQQLFLWPHLTLRRNLTLALEENGRDRHPAELDELVDLFELRELMTRYPNEVSVGQRQKAALVRALVLKPRYLLLDEITSALDVEHVGRVLDHLQVLRSNGTGILLVTHLIGFAKSAADQIIFFEDGRILESGTPALLTAPSNERLSRFLSLVHSAR